MADEEDEVVEEEVRPIIQEPSVEEVKVVEQKLLDPPKYDVLPKLGEKFQAQAVQDIILTSMKEQLLGRQYRADLAPKWSKTIANGVRQRVQDLGMKRYKIVVQVTLLELKGAGIKCGLRCIWDPETDEYIDDQYKSDTVYCHTIVFGLYMC